MWIFNNCSGSLGAVFGVAPVGGRFAGYVVRVLSVQDGTRVTTNSGERTLSRGEFWEIDTVDDEHMVFECSVPCLLAQFNKGLNLNTK